MIYFIQSGDSGPIKIGMTEGEICKRMSDLQTASPYPLHLIAVEKGARDTENFLHNKFGHLRTSGEWFIPGPDLIEYCNNLPKCVIGALHLPDLTDLEIEKNIADSVLDDILKEIEKKYLKFALKKAGFNKARAAEMLGMSPRQIRYRAEVHKIRSINDCN